MRTIRRLAVIVAILPLGLHAQAGQVVGPNGVSTLGNPTGWNPNVQAGATAQVTTTRPRLGFGGFGSGSLELSVTGAVAQNGQYPDWGFWYRYAGGTAENTLATSASFGNLASMSTLSFDWFRSFTPGWDAPVGSISDANGRPIPPADWTYKTPVLRLQLRERRAGNADVLSELVWEGYYNSTAGQYTPIDTWVTETAMQADNFWYLRPVGGSAGNGLNAACLEPMSFWQGGIVSNNQAGLFGQNGCLNGATVDVIGIAVGVGSQWPLPYHGFVDNVRMGFGQDGLALDANFDFVPGTVVPEPSTYALMAAGLLALGVVARRRRNRTRTVD